MASYSKKYTSSKDSNKHIFLTWESGYTNVKVYYKSRFVHKIDSPKGFKKGYFFDDEELKTVQLKFSSGNPIILQVSADNENFYPEINLDSEENNLKGLSPMFWIIFGFAVLATLVTLYSVSQIRFSYFGPEFYLRMGIEIAIVIVYGVVAYFLSKNQVWAYYLGGSVFILTTVLFIARIYFAGFSLMGIIISAVRIGMIIQIVRYFKVAKNTSTHKSHNLELIDNAEIDELDF